jgi:hypothetical protein
MHAQTLKLVLGVHRDQARAPHAQNDQPVSAFQAFLQPVQGPLISLLVDLSGKELQGLVGCLRHFLGNLGHAVTAAHRLMNIGNATRAQALGQAQLEVRKARKAEPAAEPNHGGRAHAHRLGQGGRGPAAESSGIVHKLLGELGLGGAQLALLHRLRNAGEQG